MNDLHTQCIDFHEERTKVSRTTSRSGSRWESYRRISKVEYSNLPSSTRILKQAGNDGQHSKPQFMEVDSRSRVLVLR